MRKSLLIVMLAVFCVSIISRSDALVVLNSNYNLTTAGGIDVFTPCGGGLTGGWVSSFSGANGISFANFSSALCDGYGAVYAKGDGWRITVPANTTIFFQVKYYATSTNGLNFSDAPFVSIMQYDSNFNIGSPVFAKSYLDSTSGSWVVKTVAFTSDSNQNIQAFIVVPDYNTSAFGDVFYFDYMRVGYVDKTSYEDSMPSDALQMYDCGFSSTVLKYGIDRGASFKDDYNTCNPLGDPSCWNTVEACSFGTRYIGGSLIPNRVYSDWGMFNNSGSNVNMTVRSWNFGEDSSVPCQAVYSNYSDNPSNGNSTYSVRIPMTISDSNDSFISGANGYNGWCGLLMKDYFYVSQSDWCMGLCFDSNRVSYAGMIEVGQSSVGSTFITTTNTGFCTCHNAYAGGNLTFSVAGAIPVSDIINASVIVGDNSTQKFRSDVLYSLYNVSGSDVRYSNISGSTFLFDTPFMDKGAFFSSPFVPSCTVGWYCEGNSEVYKNASCGILFNNTCSACGCSGSRCATGSANWTCHNSFESWHYNSTCDNDLQLLCDTTCDGVTGQCTGEHNCASDLDCSSYCNGSTRNYNGACNMTSYNCVYASELCTSGCSGGICNGFGEPPSSPPLFGSGSVTPLDAISTITGGLLSFLNVTGVPLFNIIFWIFVASIIIAVFSLIAHMVKKGFD